MYDEEVRGRGWLPQVRCSGRAAAVVMALVLLTSPSAPARCPVARDCDRSSCIFTRMIHTRLLRT